MVQALGHLSIFGPFWLPLFVLFLDRMLKKPTLTRAFLTGLFFVLTSVTNGYLGVIAVLLLFVMTAIQLLRALFSPRRPNILGVRAFVLWLRGNIPASVAFAFPLLLTVPIFLFASAGAPKWPMSEFENYSADPIDYITPSMLSPVFGETALAHRTLTYGNWIEHSLYLGIIPLLLAGYALMSKRDQSRIRYLLVGLLFFVFSLGPVLHIAGQRTSIQLPYAILMALPLLNSARVVARFGVVPLLCVSLLSSIGLNDWLRRLARTGISVRKRQVLGLFLVGLVILEFYPGIYPLTNPRQFGGSVYTWLSHQTGKYAILEYPVSSTDILAGYHVLISGKETVSGFDNLPSKVLSDYLLSVSFFQPDESGYFSRPIDISLLAKLNIHFILFHKAAYMVVFGEQALTTALLLANMTKGLRYAGDFEGTLVYEVTTS